MRQKLKTWLPWIVCIAIFAVFFARVSPREVAEALALADKPRFFAFGLVYFSVILIGDVLSLKHFLSRFATPLGFRETLFLRGATYIIMILNYAASQGGLAVYLKKTHGVGVARTLGTVMFVTAADSLLVFTSALLALVVAPVSLGGVSLRPYVFTVVPLLYVGYGAWILFWRNADKPFIAWLKKFRAVSWLLHHDVFLVFREARARDYGALFLFRAPLVAIVVGSTNLAILSFQGHVDWFWVFLYNPVIMFLSAVPITPAGLGTGQALSVLFFKGVITSPLFAAASVNPENLIFTSSLMWNLLNQLFKAIFGGYCLTKTARQDFAES